MLLVGGLTLIYFRVAGASEDNMLLSLRLSAWAALLVYLVVFVARPLNQLVTSPFSKRLLRSRRSTGIALAAIMTVHLILLLIANVAPFNIPGATVYLLMFLMVMTSFDSAPARMGPRNWRWLHKAGLYALGIGLFSAVGREFLQTPLDPVYLVLTILIMAAVAIRVTAFWKTRQN
jgi:DMSO/TMAO reductase YedYZ heme-binding membrane subunit